MAKKALNVKADLPFSTELLKELREELTDTEGRDPLKVLAKCTVIFLGALVNQELHEREGK